MNLDGPQAGLPYQLRNVPNTRSQDPHWLPDGRHSFVAWEVGFYDEQRLVVADVVMENGRLELASETDMTVVLGAQGLDLPGELNFVQWANQSAKFAFSSGDEFGSSSIYVVDLTGSTPTMTRMPKSASNQHCWAADWSGNDAYLVYEGFAQKKIKGGVYKIASDGSSSPVYLGRGVRPCWWSGDVQP
mgnify:CR=1 FL=1